jgi:hypothetical protein
MARFDPSPNGKRRTRLKASAEHPLSDTMPSHHCRIDTPRPIHLRSRVTNMRQLFVASRKGDTAWARRFKDLLADLASDLGGFENISTAEFTLVRRAAFLTLQLELLEARGAEHGGEVSAKSLALYGRITGNLRRVLQALGLQRRPRDITPDPLDYARTYHQRRNGQEDVIK